MIKTAEHLKGEEAQAAQALPIETRLRFWVAMKRGVKLGPAARYAGIEDRGVAGELLLSLLQAQQVLQGEIESRVILDNDEELLRHVLAAKKPEEP
jgi:hypothetical protein